MTGQEALANFKAKLYVERAKGKASIKELGFEPSFINGMSKVEFGGLHAKYKCHAIEVRVRVDFNPGVLTSFDVAIDGKDIDYVDIIESLGIADAWWDYSFEGDLHFGNPDFLKLLKQIVDVYLKGAA
jgi:hypothetical protein